MIDSLIGRKVISILTINLIDNNYNYIDFSYSYNFQG